MHLVCSINNVIYSGELCPSRNENSSDNAMQTCDSYIGSLTGVTILSSLVIAASIFFNIVFIVK